MGWSPSRCQTGVGPPVWLSRMRRSAPRRSPPVGASDGRTLRTMRSRVNAQCVARGRRVNRFGRCAACASCNHSFWLLRSSVRRCLPNGWPMCRSMARPGNSLLEVALREAGTEDRNRTSLRRADKRHLSCRGRRAGDSRCRRSLWLDTQGEELRRRTWRATERRPQRATPSRRSSRCGEAS